MPDISLDIIRVRDMADAREASALCRAFKAWNIAAMPDMAEQTERHFAALDFEGDPAAILALCTPPVGECLLARADGEPVGIVMLRRRIADEAEMNRLFVVESGRGRGIARALVTTLIGRARALGYRSIGLHALGRFRAAIALYRSLGFVDDPAGARRDFADEVSLRLDLG